MPSEGEHKLHPLSFVFALGGQARPFVILVFLFVFTSSFLAWQLWLLPFVVLQALSAILRSLSFRYRYGDGEMVIRTGFLFRNERHIPYQRIQNIDAVENVLHRMLRVAEVRVETAGGQEPEATMKVLPLDALEEMRRRVLVPRRVAVAEAKAAAETETEASAESAPAPRTVLALGRRELLLHGLIQNRGMVLIGAILGVAWELGLFNRAGSLSFGPRSSGRGFVSSLLAAWFGGHELSPGRLALTLLALPLFLVLVRLISMVWAAAKLHGFTLVRSGNDLRTDFGFFTKVSGTIPIGRIQTLTILEGPLHRLARRVSVRVETAGGRVTGDESGPRREWLAPILRPRELPRFLSEVLPAVDLDALDWQPLHPRAFRRALKAAVLLALPIAVAVSFLPFGWNFAAIALVAAWPYVHARRSIAHLRFAVLERAVAFRSGWLWRNTTIAPFAKLQAVVLGESPFDRRSAMASVRVDTAGAASAQHPIHIPYLGIDVARGLHRRLAEEAARTQFRW